MPLDDPCLAEEVVSALVVMMLRTGAISRDDLLSIEGLSEEASHHIAALVLEAEAPRASDWQAEQRRKRLRVVTPDGGNEVT